MVQIYFSTHFNIKVIKVFSRPLADSHRKFEWNDHHSSGLIVQEILSINLYLG
jgi:hypothetical protein